MKSQQYQIGFQEGKTEGMIEGIFKMKKIINDNLKREGLKFVSVSKKEVRHFVKTGKWSKHSQLTENSEVKHGM